MTTVLPKGSTRRQLDNLSGYVRKRLISYLARLKRVPQAASVVDWVVNHAFVSTIFSLSVVFLLVPAVFWTGAFTRTMILGGDNSFLYFAYPLQWIEHVSIPSVSSNLSGYSSATAYLPISGVIYLLNGIHFNAQGWIFGSILAASFSGTALLAESISAKAFGVHSRAARLGAIFAGVVFVCAPLLAESIWTELLPGMMWEALLPWLILIFLRHQVKGGILLPVAGAVLTAICAAAVFDAPDSIGAGCAILGILVAMFASRIWRPHILRMGVFIGSVIIGQLFWIIPFVTGFGYSQGTAALSSNVRVGSVQLLNSFTPLLSIPDALGLRQSSAMMLNYSWPQLKVSELSRSLWVIGLIPLIFAFLGCLCLVNPRFRGRPRWTMGSLVVATSLLLSLYCPRIPLGRELDSFLFLHLPGWTAEKNFYATLGLPYVLLFSLTVGYSICVIWLWLDEVDSGAIIRRWRAPAMATVLIAMILYNSPFFFGSYFREQIKVGSSANRVIKGGLPTNYLDVVNKMTHLPPGAVLSLPLLTPTWTIVPEIVPFKGSGGIYVGLSPIFALTGRSDYNGTDAFGNPIQPALPSEISGLLQAGYVSQVSKIIQVLGIRYVLLDTQDLASKVYLGLPTPMNPEKEVGETNALLHDLKRKLLYRVGAYRLYEIDSQIGLNSFATVLEESSADAANNLISNQALGI
jgi:hypothetical protein